MPFSARFGRQLRGLALLAAFPVSHLHFVKTGKLLGLFKRLAAGEPKAEAKSLTGGAKSASNSRDRRLRTSRLFSFCEPSAVQSGRGPAREPVSARLLPVSSSGHPYDGAVGLSAAQFLIQGQVCLDIGSGALSSFAKATEDTPSAATGH